MTEKGQLISLFKFLQAFGTLFRDDGKLSNGETSQEAKHFVDELLQRLEEEEKEQAILEGDLNKPTLVQELCGVKTSKHVSGSLPVFLHDQVLRNLKDLLRRL